MEIKGQGAAGGEVTGSCYVVTTDQARVLIDVGMFQGNSLSESKNRISPSAKPSSLDAILLTHAHLDHVGRVPLMIKHGFRKPIYATGATIDLAEIILRDSARLQVQDLERKNRKRRERGQAPVDALYEPEDV